MFWNWYSITSLLAFPYFSVLICLKNYPFKIPVLQGCFTKEISDLTHSSLSSLACFKIVWEYPLKCLLIVCSCFLFPSPKNKYSCLMLCFHLYVFRFSLLHRPWNKRCQLLLSLRQSSKDGLTGIALQNCLLIRITTWGRRVGN